jgi:excisionase family DNA binding protein
MGFYLRTYLEYSMVEANYLTVADLARRFGITERTVSRLTQHGQLPGFKVGGQWRFSESMLDEWVHDSVKMDWLKHEDSNGHEN